MSVYQTLLTRLRTVADLPEVQEMGKTYVPKGVTRYVRAWLIQGESQTLTVGANGQNFQQGYFQLDLFSKHGLGDDTDVAEAIRSAFSTRGLRLDCDGKQLLITKSWTGARKEEPAWLCTTINVMWEMPEQSFGDN